jgi:hypothetical protein
MLVSINELIKQKAGTKPARGDNKSIRLIANDNLNALSHYAL